MNQVPHFLWVATFFWPPPVCQNKFLYSRQLDKRLLIMDTNSITCIPNIALH